MSTDEEIAEVFNDEINRKNQQVLSKSGIYPFLGNLDGFQIEHIHGLSEDEMELLTRILEQEGDCDG